MKAKDPDISVQYVLDHVTYNPETGEFHRKKRTANRHQVGDRADFLHGKYVKVSLPVGRIRAHRLAWFIMTGAWPSALIDHKDRDVTNNRFSNLREATSSQNLRNKEGKLPVKGVSFDETRGKWVAKIKHLGKTHNLGRFLTYEEACSVMKEARDRLHGEFAQHYSQS